MGDREGQEIVSTTMIPAPVSTPPAPPPSFTVRLMGHVMPYAVELAEDYPDMRGALANMLDPNRPIPPPPVDPGPNPDYERMLVIVEGPDSGWPPAETRLLLALLKLHEPRWVGHGIRYECRGCEFQGYEAEPPDWPCETVAVVAEHLGVDLSRS